MASNSERMIEKSRNSVADLEGGGGGVAPPPTLNRSWIEKRRRLELNRPPPPPFTTPSPLRVNPPPLKFPNSLCGPHKPFETGVSPTAKLSHWGQATSRKQPECGRHGLSNILKLYEQRSCIQSITNDQVKLISYERGCRFHAGNTWCTFNINPLSGQLLTMTK